MTKPSSSRPGDRKAPRVPLPRWRRILVLLCLVGFLAFALPLAAGILNLANAAAMGGFLILAGVFLWWPGVLRLLVRLWGRTWGKVLLLLSGVGLLALLLVLGVLCCKVAARLRAVPETPCSTVIVLGCQVRGTVPSLLLSYRIQAAETYLKANPQAVAILSGGQGPGEEISEAECMYRALTDRGIDPARLYREDRSHVTLENLRFSAELMDREGLSGPVLLVSNGFHLYRAAVMAEDLGLSVQCLAARSNWYSMPTYILREALALVKYGLLD